MELELISKETGLPFSDYLARKADSRSYLCHVARMGGEAQKYMDEGGSVFGGNAGTRLGSKFDKLVEGLIGGKHAAQIVVTPPESVLSAGGIRRGKAFDAWKADLPPDAIEVSEEEHFTLMRMVDNLLACPAAKRCIQETTETQVSVFFSIDGHPLKVRPDGCTPNYWWDLKTTSSPWDKVYRSVFDFGYLEQEWLYVMAAQACGLEHHRMPFVFVQTFAPFSCHVFYLPADLVANAGERMLSVMEEVRLRRSTGIYLPADHGEITELEVPAWIRRNQEEVVEL